MVPHANNTHICLGCEGTVKLEWEYEDMGSQEQMIYDLTEREKSEGFDWNEEYDKDMKTATELLHDE